MWCLEKLAKAKRNEDCLQIILLLKTQEFVQQNSIKLVDKNSIRSGNYGFIETIGGQSRMKK